MFMIALLYISGVDLGDLVTLKELPINKRCYGIATISCVVEMIHI